MTGTGPMRAAVEQAVAESAFPAGRFHLLGEVSDLGPYLGSCDALVLTSRLDGRPMIVLEALATGVPVVASRVGAIPELITDGVNGYICDVGDADAFVDRLRRLVSSPRRHI